MRSYASIIKEIELSNLLIDTFVIVPLDDELRCNKGENVTHSPFCYLLGRLSAVNLIYLSPQISNNFRR